MPFKNPKKKQAYNRRYGKIKNARLEVKERQRESWLRRAYGISPAEYDALLSSQGGVCAICRSNGPDLKRQKRLPVDHCHESRRVRGILCARCNSMIGLALDDPDLLEKAREYLRKRR